MLNRPSCPSAGQSSNLANGSRPRRTVSKLSSLNLYRLVRAAVPADDLDRFVEEDHEAVAVMLAILIDSPSLAMRLFSAINDARAEPPEGQFLPALMKSLSPPRPDPKGLFAMKRGPGAADGDVEASEQTWDLA